MKKTEWDKRFFHGRYNKWPFTDVVSFVMRRFGAAPDRSQVRILDLGCGGSHHLMFLAHEGFAYYGIDGASESISIAVERLTAAGFPSQTVVQGELGQLPYEDNFFDGVIDRGSLTCNRLRDMHPLIAETRRVLKPGGTLYSTILGVGSTSKETGEHLGDNDYADLGDRLKGAGVIHYTDAREAERLFAAFRIDSIVTQITRTDYPRQSAVPVTEWVYITCTK